MCTRMHLEGLGSHMKLYYYKPEGRICAAHHLLLSPACVNQALDITLSYLIGPESVQGAGAQEAVLKSHWTRDAFYLIG